MIDLLVTNQHNTDLLEGNCESSSNSESFGENIQYVISGNEVYSYWLEMNEVGVCQMPICVSCT